MLFQVMRIISGHHKGKKILAPKSLPVRPTTDRSKEGLFNILQNHIEFKNLHVLDLFSGTGSISYDFASRGVASITSVDQNKKCIKFIQKTSQRLTMKITTVQNECLKFLKLNNTKFDLIFADPPYDFEEEVYIKIIDLALNRLNSDGILIIEHYKQKDLSNITWFSFDRRYGNNVFSFFKFN